MPFIDDAHRASPDMEIPGDRCFREYKYIMDQWAKSPRWSTIDQLAERLYPDAYERAFFLAFFVFFVTHGMYYEQEKRIANGDVTGEVE